MRRKVRATVCIDGRTFVIGTEQEVSLGTMEPVWRISVAESYPTGAGTYRTHDEYETEADALTAALGVVINVVTAGES